MAGRKPKTPAHKVTPLRGRAARPRQLPQAGYWADGEWYEPGDESRRDGFDPGNSVFEGEDNPNFTHGAKSGVTVAERAAKLLTSALEDGTMPDHLRSPAFRSAVQAWAEAEAVASLLFDWLNGKDVEESVRPPLAATKAPVDLWRSAHSHAANLRSKLGIDPVSFARIRADLGLNHKANEDALEKLSGTGAAIVARRLELEGGRAAP